MGRRIAVVQTVGVVWAGFVLAMLLAARPSVTPDARAFVTAAGLVAIAAALGAVGTAGRSPNSAGAFLVVSALAAPTFGALWLNIVPLVVGLRILFGRRRATTAEPLA